MAVVPRFRLRVPLLVAGLATGLAGCSGFDLASRKVASVITPYSMDIVQGNVVTREQVAVLKPGMSRNQVRDILGTALISSVFHANRWDYAFTLKSQGLPAQSRKVSVFFKDDVMDRVESDELPSESEFASTLKSRVSGKGAPVLEASPQSLAAFPVATKPAPPVVAEVKAPASYPPLEPAAR